MPQSALIGAFLAGLLGGLHCVVMCGGWLAVAGGSEAAPMLPARVLYLGQLASHAGRLATYVALGALFGAAGGVAIAAAVTPVQRGLYGVANVLLLVLALSIAARGIEFAPLERAGLALFRKLLPAVTRLAPKRGLAGRFLLGSIWGATPCALVYSVLPVALLAGGAFHGALVMLAFGLGTLPNLLAAGVALARSRQRFAQPALRYAAAAVVALFAIVGLYRVAFAPESLAQGPFCLVP